MDETGGVSGGGPAAQTSDAQPAANGSIHEITLDWTGESFAGTLPKQIPDRGELHVYPADRSWRHWLRDWGWFAGGFLLVQGPVLAWFGSSVGVVTLWREVVVHPLAMLQALPAPDMQLPARWERGHISRSFYTIALRAYVLLYLGYAAALLYLWWRCLREGRPFRHALLLATVTWGGIYFIRSFGRADEPHLDSAIPPVCLLLAHLLSLVPRLPLPRPLDALRGRSWARPVALGAAFAAWVFLLGSDRYVYPRYRGAAFIPPVAMERLEKIRRWTQPGDEILDLTASPMLHVLAERPGPGYFDVIMPGTFLTRRDEVRFIAHLAQSPPALVIWRASQAAIPSATTR